MKPLLIMKPFLISLIGPLIFLSCGPGKEENKKTIPQKPNIVFVLVDDLGIKDLGFTGSTYYETPNIDKLASKAAIFTQGYAGSRVCSPSRATIMTGKFTARHGITNWIGEKTGTDWRSMNRHDKSLPAEYVHNLPHEDITIAESLKANGYKTFFAGKWHLGNVGSYPEDHGFDINKGGYEKGGPQGGFFSPFKNPKLQDKENGENLSIRLANETADFIKQNKTNPFFAFLSFYAVHAPIQTTQEKWKKFRDKALKQGIKDSGYIMERLYPIRQTQDNPIYGGLVETMDDAVGIVLKALQEANLDKNTMVIFTSDNGGVASGDAYSTSNLPYKGGKGYQWEGGIREPFVIYVPWQNSNGIKIDFPVTGADFYPTILDYANINLLPEQHKDGVSLKPVISENATLEERPLYWHYPHYGNQGGNPSSIIRKGEWKLIHYYDDNTNELYNLKSDPFEKSNVINDYSEISKDLYANLNNWLLSMEAKFPEPDPKFDAKKRAQYKLHFRENFWPRLEKERLEILSEDFIPNKKWWGSKLTKD